MPPQRCPNLYSVGHLFGLGIKIGVIYDNCAHLICFITNRNQLLKHLMTSFDSSLSWQSPHFCENRALQQHRCVQLKTLIRKMNDDGGVTSVSYKLIRWVIF